MKITSVFLAAIGLVAGLIAAYNWYKSANIEDSEMLRESRRSNRSQPFTIDDMEFALRYGLRQASWFNRTAALWTAISVVFNALAALVESLSN
jgi:hypothetical protein